MRTLFTFHFIFCLNAISASFLLYFNPSVSTILCLNNTLYRKFSVSFFPVSILFLSKILLIFPQCYFCPNFISVSIIILSQFYIASIIFCLNNMLSQQYCVLPIFSLNKILSQQHAVSTIFCFNYFLSRPYSFLGYVSVSFLFLSQVTFTYNQTVNCFFFVPSVLLFFSRLYFYRAKVLCQRCFHKLLCLNRRNVIMISMSQPLCCLN